jgi:hypothetical protein
MIKIKKYNIINETEDDIISDIIKICYDINTLDNNSSFLYRKLWKVSIKNFRKPTE